MQQQRRTVFAHDTEQLPEVAKAADHQELPQLLK